MPRRSRVSLRAAAWHDLAWGGDRSWPQRTARPARSGPVAPQLNLTTTARPGPAVPAELEPVAPSAKPIANAGSAGAARYLSPLLAVSGNGREASLTADCMISGTPTKAALKGTARAGLHVPVASV